MTVKSMKKPEIMIVEDELIVAENLAKNLNKLGYKVTAIIDSGEDAITQAVATHPDMILMDIMLQGDLDGVEAAGEIHSQLHIPVIYMTAYADNKTIDRAKKTEPYGYLVKPFKPQDIQATIEVALHRHHVEQVAINQHLNQIQILENNLHYFVQQSLKNSQYKRAINPLNQTSENIDFAADLPSAIEQQEFQLDYQPKLDIKTGKIISLEALMRWFHPVHGMISPNLFIPLAEKMGLISSLDQYALEEACRKTLVLHQMGFKGMRIAVNLSGQQLHRPNLSQQILEIAKRVGLDPFWIELELTESTLVNDIVLACENLTKLKNLGIKIAIDDFGTGYSSLSYLQHFSFNTLKIDRSFIQNIDQNRKNQVIVTSMLLMAEQLNLNTIAEGVETEEELDFLQRHNCDAVQGYLISKPLPWDEFIQFMTRS